MDPAERRLEQIVRTTPRLMRALVAVRDAQIPDGYIAAGAIRDTVWDALSAQTSAGEAAREDANSERADVDVVYFEKTLTADWTAELFARCSDVNWELTNQGTVHHWQSEQLGRNIHPYASISDALASWPETATAVAVRLTRLNEVEVIAPFGLRDLFELTLRPNPRCPDPNAFAQRVVVKRWLERWQGLRVVV